MTPEEDLTAFVGREFERRGVHPVNVRVRSFPGERIVIVEVASQLERAMEIGGELDSLIPNGFVTVRQIEEAPTRVPNPVTSVRDERVTRLIGLLDARSRTSEAQPSLRYIEDVTGRLQVAKAPRHHLIFGRRGAGKSALMVETRTQLERAGVETVWLNVQTVRQLGSAGAFLTLASRLCDLPISRFESRPKPPQSLVFATRLKAKVDGHLAVGGASPQAAVDVIVPELNALMRIYCTEVQVPVYIFLDDVHYLPYSAVPAFLDHIHGVTRDNPVWLKVAGIRHQMRWFIPEPPTGLQLPHDAIEIDLDITLQEPERARRFLQNVLDAFIEECSARPKRGFISATALDRLVLASGAVPRDFVTLCAKAIQVARGRPKARTTGVQDVNEAAGQAAKGKLQELEEDAAAALGTAAPVLSALQVVRTFCLQEKEISFFGVEFIEKETHGDEYSLIQRLLDLRILHLIHGSLSDQHHVGRRSEIYLLDLSEYTGARLKQKLWVLDLEGGHLRLKRTRSDDAERIGDTPVALVTILRRGPSFPLQRLSHLVTAPADEAPSRGASL